MATVSLLDGISILGLLVISFLCWAANCTALGARLPTERDHRIQKSQKEEEDTSVTSVPGARPSKLIEFEKLKSSADCLPRRADRLENGEVDRLQSYEEHIQRKQLGSTLPIFKS